MSANRPGGDRAEQRGAARRDLARGGDETRPGRSCRPAAASSAGSSRRSRRRRRSRVEAHPVLLEVVHDPPVAERDRFEQRPVDLGGRVLERQPEDDAAQIGVGEDRAVAVPPVEREQAGRAGRDPRRRARAAYVAARRRRACRRTTRACRRRRPARPRSRTCPGRIPSRTTPVIPGRRISSSCTTMSQIDVPMTITNVSGIARRRARNRDERVDVADGDRDRRRAGRAGRRAPRAAFPARLPSGDELVSRASRSGSEKPG